MVVRCEILSSTICFSPFEAFSTGARRTCENLKQLYTGICHPVLNGNAHQAVMGMHSRRLPENLWRRQIDTKDQYSLHLEAEQSKESLASLNNKGSGITAFTSHGLVSSVSHKGFAVFPYLEEPGVFTRREEFTPLLDHQRSNGFGATMIVNGMPSKDVGVAYNAFGPYYPHTMKPDASYLQSYTVPSFPTKLAMPLGYNNSGNCITSSNANTVGQMVQGHTPAVIAPITHRKPGLKILHPNIGVTFDYMGEDPGTCNGFSHGSMNFRKHKAIDDPFVEHHTLKKQRVWLAGLGEKQTEQGRGGCKKESGALISQSHINVKIPKQGDGVVSSGIWNPNSNINEINGGIGQNPSLGAPPTAPAMASHAVSLPYFLKENIDTNPSILEQLIQSQHKKLNAQDQQKTVTSTEKPQLLVQTVPTVRLNESQPVPEKMDKDPTLVTADFKREGTGVVSQTTNSWGDVDPLLDGNDGLQKAAIQKGARRIEEQNKMFAAKKLSLVLDLDNTLLHSARFNELDAILEEKLCKKEGEDPLKPQRHLICLKNIKMWTKLRPGIWNFLEKASKLYELHIWTMGSKAYAAEIAKVLDPTGTLFAGRVISREDRIPIDAFQRVHKSKDLHGVLGTEKAVVIIDDSLQVWPDNKRNVINIERYTYFPCGLRQFGRPCPSLLEFDNDEEVEDGALASSLEIIERIHAKFFSDCNPKDEDVRNILASERRTVLADCRILFSQIIPVGEANPHLHPLWRVAEKLGAVCTNQIDENVTHVVANSPGTEKVIWGWSTGRFVVQQNWLEASAKLYRRAKEHDFALMQ